MAAPSSTYCVATSNMVAVVSTTAGAVSATTALVRSSCEPGVGAASGTAMKPACMAARNATMYGRPCGAMISARSPTAPCWLISSARLRVRRYSADQVRVSTTPAGSRS